MPELKLERSERCLALLPMVVLLTVAAFHAHSAHAFALSPWKGGGFGMFSTADGPAARFVRVLLVNSVDGRTAEIPVRVPTDRTDIARLTMSARTMPVSGDTQRLAEALVALPWRIYDREDKVGGNKPTFTIAPEGTRGLISASSTPAVFTAVRVEVRRVKLNTHDWSISSELIYGREAKR